MLRQVYKYWLELIVGKSESSSMQFEFVGTGARRDYQRHLSEKRSRDAGFSQDFPTLEGRGESEEITK
jgi:hypothetical protein